MPVKSGKYKNALILECNGKGGQCMIPSKVKACTSCIFGTWRQRIMGRSENVNNVSCGHVAAVLVQVPAAAELLIRRLYFLWHVYICRNLQADQKVAL